MFRPIFCYSILSFELLSFELSKKRKKRRKKKKKREKKRKKKRKEKEKVRVRGECGGRRLSYRQLVVVLVVCIIFDAVTTV